MGLGKSIDDAKSGKSNFLRGKIEDYLNSIKSEDRSNELHPSNCMACGRQIIYGMLDETPILRPIAPSLRMIFDIGHALHHMIQEYFIQAGWCPDEKEYPVWEEDFIEFCNSRYKGTPLVDYGRLEDLLVRFRWCMNKYIEVPLSEMDYMLMGHADALVTIDGVDLIVDIKTINSYRYKKLKAPEQKDQTQLLLYMYFLSKSRGMLLYFPKDSCKDWKEFLIKMEDWSEVVQTKLDWFKMLKGSYEAGAIPKRERSFGSDDCKQCDYQRTCWAEEFHDDKKGFSIFD